MTTPEELDIKIKELRSQLDSMLIMRQPTQKAQKAQPTQPAQRYTIKATTPEEFSIVIEELKQQLNII